MNALGYVLPGPTWLWRVCAYALLVLSIFGYGWFKGSEHWHGVLIEQQAAALKEGARIGAVREKVTTKIVEKYIPMLAEQLVVTQTITKEIPVYVPLTDPDLGAGWRELHDAAATGRLPRPPEAVDGGPVKAQDAASVVTENYGLCRRDQLKLEGLQNWITDQQKVR